MKVESKQPAEATPTEPKSKFSDVLKKAPEHAKAAGSAKSAKQGAPAPHAAKSAGKASQVSSTAATQPVAMAEVRAAAHKTAESLQSARKGMNAEAKRLDEVRTDSHAQTEQKVEGRVLELIVDELKEEFGVAKKASDQSATQPMSKAEIARVSGEVPKLDVPSESVPRVEDIAKLVEQIRMFVKNNRPAMAISVGGALNAQVEIERTGPKQVSIKVVGRGALPKTADINKIRESLAEKGIKVAAVEVALKRSK